MDALPDLLPPKMWEWLMLSPTEDGRTEWPCFTSSWPAALDQLQNQVFDTLGWLCLCHKNTTPGRRWTDDDNQPLNAIQVELLRRKVREIP